jgi:hypothetical protein
MRKLIKTGDALAIDRVWMLKIASCALMLGVMAAMLAAGV